MVYRPSKELLQGIVDYALTKERVNMQNKEVLVEDLYQQETGYYYHELEVSTESEYLATVGRAIHNDISTSVRNYRKEVYNRVSKELSSRVPEGLLSSYLHKEITVLLQQNLKGLLPQVSLSSKPQLQITLYYDKDVKGEDAREETRLDLVRQLHMGTFGNGGVHVDNYVTNIQDELVSTLYGRYSGMDYYVKDILKWLNMLCNGVITYDEYVTHNLSDRLIKQEILRQHKLRTEPSNVILQRLSKGYNTIVGYEPTVGVGYSVTTSTSRGYIPYLHVTLQVGKYYYSVQLYTNFILLECNGKLIYSNSKQESNKLYTEKIVKELSKLGVSNELIAVISKGINGMSFR